MSRLDAVSKIFSSKNHQRAKAYRSRIHRELKKRNKFAVETLEPRLLLDASTPLLAQQAAALNAGLSNLEPWADTLNTVGLFTQQIPIVNRSITQALDIGDVLKTKLADAVATLGATPTPNDVKDKLNEAGFLGAGAVTINTADASEVSFNVVYGFDGTVDTYLNLPANDNLVSLDGPKPSDPTFNKVTLNTHLDLSFTFGINLTAGLAASESFFIKLTDTDGSGPLTGFNAGVDFSGALPSLQANVGILDVTAGGASSSFALNVDLGLKIVDPDNSDGLNHVTLAELQGTSLSSLIPVAQMSKTGTLTASLPVSATLGAYSAAATIGLTDSNLFDATLPSFSFTGVTHNLDRFRNMSPQNLVVLLQQVGTTLEGISDALNPIGGVPFLDDTIGSVANFAQSFNDFASNFYDIEYSGAESYTGSSLPALNLAHNAVFQISTDGVIFSTKTLNAAVFADTAALITALNTALDAGDGDHGVTASDDGTGHVKFSRTGNFVLRYESKNLGMPELGFERTLANAAFKFTSIQGFISILDDLIPLNLAQIGVAFDETTNDLTFRIQVNPSFHKDVDLDFGKGFDTPLGEFNVTGNASLDFDVSASIDATLGANLNPIGYQAFAGSDFITTSTLLSALNGGQGIQYLAGNDFTVTLSTGASFQVDIDGGDTTIQDVIDAFNAARNAASLSGAIVLEIVPDDPATSAREDVALRVRETGAPGAGVLMVTRVAPVVNGPKSLAAVGLGIAGLDVDLLDGVSQITGVPLHGDSFNDHFFIKEGATFSASATISAPTDSLDLFASLGILEAGIVDGEGSISISTSFKLNDPGTDPDDQKITFPELVKSPIFAKIEGTAAAPANGQLSADAAFSLKVNGLGAGDGIAVTVTAASTADNTSLNDLIEDIDDALDATNFPAGAPYDGTPFQGKDLSDFVFVGSNLGKITLTGMVRTLQITAAAVNPAVTELMLPTSLTSEESLMETGTLSASGSLDLPLTFPGLGLIQGLGFPVDPKIHLEFSAGSPIDFIPTFPGLPSTEDIANLANLSSVDFFTVLTKILEALQDPNLDLLHKNLPLIDKSVDDLLSFTQPIQEALDSFFDHITNFKQDLLLILNGPSSDSVRVEASGAAPSNGQLSSDGTFTLEFNSLGSAISVTVTAASTSTNANVADLVADIQAALNAKLFPAGAPYDGTEFQGKDLGDFVNVSETAGTLALTGSVTNLKITVADGNSAKTQLKFYTTDGETKEGPDGTINSIREILMSSTLAGKIEQVLGSNVLNKFVNAVDALEGAIMALPDSIADPNLFQLPGRITAAMAAIKDAVAAVPDPTALGAEQALFDQFRQYVQQLKRSIPGVQQLADLLFDALNLRDLIKDPMITDLKTTVVMKIQDAANAIGDSDATHTAAKNAFLAIQHDLVAVLNGINTVTDLPKLDLVELLNVFNDLNQALVTHAAVLPDTAATGEPIDLLHEAVNLFNASFPGRVHFNFDGGKELLTFGLDFDVSAQKTVNLDFDLEDVPGVSGIVPVDLKTGGELTVGIGAGFTVDFGIDLDQSDLSKAFGLLPTTEFDVKGLINGTGLSAELTIGGIGAKLHDGSVLLQHDITDGVTDDAASLTLALNKPGFDSDSDGFVDPGELLNALDLTVDGAFKLSTVVQVFGVDLAPNLEITIPLATLNDTSTWTYQVPTIDFSAAKLDLMGIINAIESFLGFLSTTLDSELLSELPLVGDDLSTASSAINDFKDLVDQIRTTIEANISDTSVSGAITEALQKLLFDTLGPGLPSSDTSVFNLGVTPLNILKLDPTFHDDGMGNAEADYRDVPVTVTIDEDGNNDTPGDADDENMVTDPDAAVTVKLHLAKEETFDSQFKLGFNAFNLIGASTAGSIALGLGFDVELGLKLDKPHGVSLVLNDDSVGTPTPDLPGAPDFGGGVDPEIEATLGVELADGSTIALDLFFLRLEATNQDSDMDMKSTGFSGTAAIDLSYGLPDVPILNITDIHLDADLNFDVEVDLGLNASVAGNKNLPSLRADLLLGWNFDIDTGAGPVDFQINDFGLDLGEFISKEIKPILVKINQFLEPIRPILDFLEMEVPIISQLSQLVGQGEFTFLDGISLLGEGGDTVAQVIEILIGIDNFVEDIADLPGSIFIEFGDFSFGDDLRSASTVEVNNAVSSILGPLNAYAEDLVGVLDDLGFGGNSDADEVKGFLTDANKSDADGGLNIQFPILTNPANALKILFGQDADLITMDIPRMEASFEFSQIFGPIIPPFPVFAKIGGSFGVFLDLFVGMDTRGLRTANFLNGFYFGDFTDGPTGSEMPEAGVFMELTAGAEFNIAFAKAGVEGGIRAEINADWHDEASPGKVYLDEILANLQRGIDCIFDLSGELSAFLRAYLEIVIPLGFTDITIIDVSFTIVDITLLDFTHTCPPLPPPEPAQLNGSTLELNIGPNAGRRQPGATDGDEMVTVYGEFDRNGDGTLSQTVDKNGDGKITEEELGEDLNNNGMIDSGVVAVVGFGQTRLFGPNGSLPASFFKSTTAVTQITGNAGAGDDSITLNHVRVPASLIGGAGDDELFVLQEVMGAPAVLPASPSDTIMGGDGNDQISGGRGNDNLFGDGGNDTIFGGAGSDTVDGGSGDDVLYGGSNDNDEGSKTASDAGDDDLGDSVLGGDGNDKLYGHKGNDTMKGGAGADFLGGDVGNDSLIGDADDDTILGGAGNDTIQGNTGDDQLKGEDGNDSISAGSGNDYVEGGGGSDTITGEAGDDKIIGGRADTSTGAADGNDLIDGGANDDIIVSDDGIIGSVTLLGGAGNDTIFGGTGSDLIYGQGGDDIVFGDDATPFLPSQSMYESSNTASGGNDTIYGNEGSDVLVGGTGSDKVFGGDDSSVDTLLGDNGKIVFTGAVLTLIQSTAFANGGNDTLQGGAGDDVEIGGFGGDFILGQEGADILIGDHGEVSRWDGTAGSTLGALKQIKGIGTDQGGNDTIGGHDGSDTILGGKGNDSITGNNQNDVIHGDNAQLDYNNTGVIKTITSIAVTDFGDDEITGFIGDDTILGGSGKDTIGGGTGKDVILGDNGTLDYSVAATNGDGVDGTLDLIETTFPSNGDNDVITGDSGADTVLGGVGDDSISGDGAADVFNDVLLGDNGFIRLDAACSGNVKLIESTDPTQGGKDTITGGQGNDVIVGGSGGLDTTPSGGDSLFGNDGDDIVIGDNVRITRDSIANLVAKIQTIFSTNGGDDYIEGNAGKDVLLGGYGRDTITGGTGDDVALGDNGELLFDSDTDLTKLDVLRTTFPVDGHADLISGDAGADVVMGGSAGDTIYGDNSTASNGANDLSDILLGDNGEMTLLTGPGAIVVLGGTVQTIRTTDSVSSTGGQDTVSGNAGGDVILGGVQGDTLYGDAAATGANDGDDIMLGDNGRLEWKYQGAGLPIETGFVFDNSLTTLDLITTELPAAHPGGRDLMYGDNGKDVMFGGEDVDKMFGDDGVLVNLPEGLGAATNNDLMFGDHGRLYPPFSAANLSGVNSMNFFSIDTGDSDAGQGDLMWGEEGNDIMLGGQGDDRMFGGSGDDDMIGGHNVAGGIDELTTSSIDATGSSFNDLMDGGSGNDSMAGDNAVIWRRNDTTSPRFRTLSGSTLYTVTEIDITANVNGTAQNDPSGAVGRDITLLDHSFADESSKKYGNDAMAGGAGKDTMFGELGNDLMAGDGSIGSSSISDTKKTINVNDIPGPTDETLYFNVPESASTDGDDYMEGNGGSDTMFGGLGQDDIIGGSSSLFGLTTSTQRPDGSDLIFGGAGTRIDRDVDPDGYTAGHGKDSDFIMGDNADIYRIVQVNGSTTFRSFTYDDTYSTDIPLVVRAMKQLDYTLGGGDYDGGGYNADGQATPTGKPVDNGKADLMFGEDGDDFIYGMTGSDVIFGNAQDDDIVGGYGNDWVSGGRGTDGVIGDDGLISTSRNGLTETLWGLTTAVQTDVTISTPGKIQIAVINPTGELKKVTDLVPFSYDKNWVANDDEYPDSKALFADDIIFGGIGSDFLHSGSGDDAISGAEALAAAYVPTYTGAVGSQVPGAPLINLGYDAMKALAVMTGINLNGTANPGGVLSFYFADTDGLHLNNRFRAGEFDLYDEFNALKKVLLNADGSLNTDGTGFNFLLNFNAAEGVARPGGTVPKSTGQQAETYPATNDDGRDAIFGDNGNDWLVGGSGRDDIFGGWGNDLLNSDDNQDTNGGLNNAPDTSPWYEDRAYGGAGRDVLIGNTGGDRNIDWVGEYNSYIVPYAPFGEASVSRTLQPQLPEFLYELSKADGADPTRGGSPRNGEPGAELGLVLQKDFAWQDQTGAPADPQAGNIPGGPRDVLRTAGFNDGTPQGFYVDSGTFEVKAGRLSVTSALGGDAVSVFYLDSYVPSYFEILATINAAKPTGGYNSNAYVIFDYQSPTSFKFAGVNVSTNKLEIGERSASGWNVKVQGVYPGSVKSNTDYNVFVAINGNAVTLIVNNQVTLDYTFAARVTPDGVSHSINEGMVGLGSQNGSASIDNVTVQRLAPTFTFSKTEDFSVAPTLFPETSGAWTLSAGRYIGTATASTPTINQAAFNIGSNYLLALSATFKTGGEGGFVFDLYSSTDFKYVTVSAGKITLGHRTASGFVTDAVYNHASVELNTDETIGVTLKGTTISVTRNVGTATSTVISFVYNGVLTDGGFGMFSRTGATSFDSVTVMSDDPRLLNQ